MTLKERVDRHEREIAAIRKLILAGMKLINQNQLQLRELAAAQKRTDQNLNRLEAKVEQLVDGMRRTGGNGHSRRKLDFQ